MQMLMHKYTRSSPNTIYSNFLTNSFGMYTGARADEEKDNSKFGKF